MHVHYCVEVMGDLPGGEFICIVAIWARVTSPKMEGNLCRVCVYTSECARSHLRGLILAFQDPTAMRGISHCWCV